ncbi:peptide/nickel transport system substrate-binding protein/oligopeptide transport system substrate-binding protein [Allocatelliglobosispora scoriae]|uniref:Peptide/nickel transport system substrate-binding protein/oligopeptide transport system substrate-binding protein n=1 Tax=Allocatelliglobosispora scoriae TaxID=643052 RepID=A0A841BY20_9ACTN|nr:ABC transporter substrate-binding protein [Allocatelliglobosispora scoriae]MBB5871571.1 peptide/nickel transport system substrate-binding protein/oligopeptide transport system substrate-binding protein [Allocatelliglobosispora scoriae]
MQVRRLASWTAIPLVAALGLAACGSGSDSGGSSAGVVRIGIAEPKHLIPTNTSEVSGSQVLAALFAPLVDFDADNKPVEVQAESVKTTDNKVWTIKLKDGWTFHNGEKVTSDSYINAWNYGAYGPNAQDNNYFFEKIDGYAAMNPLDPDGTGPQTAPAPSANKLKGLAKVDDTTFTVTLSAPFSEFKSIIGYTAFYALPQAAWESEGKLKADFENAPIGNGPFKMKGTWKHDQQIEVEKYDGYAGSVKPTISGAQFKVYQQPSAEYAALLANDNDVMKAIPAENLSTVEGDLGDRYLHSPASALSILAFPTYDKNYSNPNVRKAISMAIDRDAIVTQIFKGTQKSARSFVSPVVAGYRDNTCGAACEYKPGDAKTLYQANQGPAKLTISYNADGAGNKDWVEATCNQLKTNLGVDCTALAEPKFADLLTKVQNKEAVGMFRMGWSMDYPSMENYLGPLYTTRGSSNYYGYSNPAFDALVAEGSAAATQEAAIAKYQQAEDILAQDLPVLPLRFGQNNYGISTKVKNVEIDLFNRVDLMKIEYIG